MRTYLEVDELDGEIDKTFEYQIRNKTYDPIIFSIHHILKTSFFSNDNFWISVDQSIYALIVFPIQFLLRK
jgi:hypothetical protein